ncbi:MAG TPA: valine--tRNA ligase [Bacteroidales bacterium]|nr:valine--tRNA ligase [Bacteroidales bacterium]
MKTLESKYNPLEIENKWYKYWLNHKMFHSVPDHREPYTIVIPPPNVTGVLHMGHMLNNTLQDVLIRRARMKGKNACWVPGTDHASIATEAKVVAKLKAEGIDKNSLTREEFLKHAWEWKEKHGGIILEQLKKLGASCDWDRTCFTMDPSLSESVIKVFVDLFNKGLIYRGIRIVNWDPQAKTALSDEEVIYKEENSNLYYVKYFVEDTNEFIPVATTRPETILGDTALCVNPNDERYKKYHGKKVRVPLVNRMVPVITDEYVEMDFGTGALKVTPAHDPNDYELGIKYNLEVIDTFNEDGTLNEKAQLFVGVDRFEARKLVAKELEKEGLLIKTEAYLNKVGYSERTNVVIEPRISTQWFLKMKKLSEPALENVMNDTIQLIPPKFKNTYRHWMENVKDWCISRQLWWGHRIPAWYINHNPNEFVVAENEEKALELAKKKYPAITKEQLSQDNDVLDTWFSSWLWPISVFDGIRHPDNEDIRYYYPTNDLITAPEILFFWVARMIIAGYEYRNEKPFKNVYLTGIVRDKLGRKMSKSLGNSPDPIELMQKYGADGVRVGMLLCSPAGNDLPFDEALTEQGRNFANKIWNAFRLIQQWQVDENAEQPEYAQKAIAWYQQSLNNTIIQSEDDFDKYRISEALMEIYKAFWDEFSSWFLEIIKPPFGQPIDKITYQSTLSFFDTLLKLLHPFMPFITEELWQHLNNRKDGESIMYANYPTANNSDKAELMAMEEVKQLITQIRNIRIEKNIPQKEKLILSIQRKNYHLTTFLPIVQKLANLEQISFEKPETAAIGFLVGTTEYFVPLNQFVNAEEEIEKIKKEIEYYQGFLHSVNKKLQNENFVSKAPAQVIENEKAKKHDAETKLAALEKQLEQFSTIK